MHDVLNIHDILELKSSLIGEEAVAWQKTSKVGEQMVALFDKCKEYRRKHFIAEENNWKEVAHEISSIIKKELPPIWKKELGLDIRKINFNCEEPSGFVAIDYMSHEDIEAVYFLDKVVEGSYSQDEVPKKYLKRMKEMINKADSFDRLKGKLKGKTWNIELYIDITLFFFYDLFCPKSLLNDKTLSAEMTSRECTAILLHEAGHAMFIIERIAYGYSVQLQFTKLVNGFFKSNPSVEDIREFCISIIGTALKVVSNKQDIDTLMKNNIEEIRSFINKVVSFCDFVISIKEKIKVTFTSGYEDPEITKISESTNTEEYTDNDSIVEYGCVLMMKIISTIFELISTLYWPLVLYTISFTAPLYLACGRSLYVPIFIALIKILKIFEELEPETHNNNPSKSSDMKGTGHEVYLNERSADEHVVRHGFAGDLASSLIKIRMLFDTVFPSQNNYIRNSKLLLVLSKFSEFVSKIDKGTDTYYCYEWDDKRIRRICQNCISFFKNTKISPEYRDNMLISLRRALDCLDKLDKDLYNRDKTETLIKVIRNLIKPAEWIRILTSGRLTQEYEQHINQIEDLSNSLMFAHSAQFKKIINDMKKKK